MVDDLVALDMQTAMMRVEMYRARCCNPGMAACTVFVKCKTSVGVLSERGLILVLQEVVRIPRKTSGNPRGAVSPLTTVAAHAVRYPPTRGLYDATYSA